MITQRFLWSIWDVKHSQGLRGTGWTLLWLHWLALRKRCAVGCGDDLSRVIARHDRIYIFRKGKHFIGMQLFLWKKTCHFQVSRIKKTSSSTHVAKTLCQVSHLHVRRASAKHLQASRLLSGWRL